MNFGPLKTKEICQLVYQTASAIKYLNQCENCIHRDLKPENILIGPELFEQIRVTDYGLARIFPEGIQDEAKAATANVGSDGYQAPETMSMDGDNLTMYGKQCDLFSLGVITYIVAVAAPPFGLGPSARRGDIRAGRYKPMEGGKWKSVAPEIKELIKGLLLPDPEKRLTVEDVLSNPFIKKNAGVPVDQVGMEAALEADLARAAAEAGK